jgi:putative alpha-1,2-mannosidase
VAVRTAICHRIRNFLVPRLAIVAISELEALDSLMLQVQLIDLEDVRTSTFEKWNHSLNNARIYRASTSDGRRLPAFKFV